MIKKIATTISIICLGFLFGFFLVLIAHADETVCWPRNDAIGRLQFEAQHAGNMSRLFSREATQSFLDVVNKTGDPTDFKADEIFVVLIPENGAGLVFFISNGCVDRGPLVIGARLFIEALKAANEVGI